MQRIFPIRPVIILAFAFALTFIVEGAYGQKPSTIFVDVGRKLNIPVSGVVDIFQDDRGVMWFAGTEGLTRYDGFEYHVFNGEIQDSTALTGNNVSCVSQDKYGRIWAGTTMGGINYSNLSHTGFNHFPSGYFGSNKKLSSAIYDVVVDGENRVWLAGNLGIHILIEENNRFTLVNPGELLNVSNSSIDSLIPHLFFLDSNKRMWIATRKGACFVDLDALELQTPQTNVNLPTDYIDDIKADHNGIIWMSRKKKGSRLIKMPNLSEPIQVFDEIPFTSSRTRLHFTFDADNRLWAAAFAEGLFGYDLTKEELFLQSNKENLILEERFIRRPFVDRDGNVWVPSYGLFRHDYSRGFLNYQHPLDFTQSHTSTFHEKDFVWSGYRERGFIKLDKRTNEIQHFNADDPGPYKLPTNLVHEFLRLSNGKMAMLGFPYLMILDEEHGELKSIRLKGASRALHEDKNQNLWVGGFYGMEQYTLDGEKIEEYRWNENAKPTRMLINCIEEDRHGNFWFGTSGVGLGHLNVKTGKVEQYLPKRDSNSLSSYHIHDSHLDEDEVLWLATNLGLCRMDLKSRKFSSYNTKYGFSDNHLCAVVEDDENRLWISSYSGIFSFDKRTKEVKTYTMLDGLSNNVFYNGDATYYQGKVYFGGKNGMDFFNPNDIRSHKSKLRPLLKSMKINNSETIDILKVDLDKPLKLNHQADLIQLSFGATRYLTDEFVEYQYKLEELQEEWVSIGNQRQILFTDLAPEDYVAKIRARSTGEDWSTHILEVPFLIKTPWWMLTWVRVLFGALLITCIYAAIKLREKGIRRRDQAEAAVKQRIMELEKKALLSQMNPHFIFNSMNAIQQFISIGDNERAMRYLSKFGRLLRKMLAVSEKEIISVAEDISMIESYLEVERLRYPNRLNHTIHISPNLDAEHTQIPSLLIQPHVEQAVQNSLLNTNQSGEIKITISKVDQLVRVLIQDNGTQEGGQNGLTETSDMVVGTTIVEERLKHINRKIGHQKVKKEQIRDQENNRIGTRVELLIDIK